MVICCIVYYKHCRYIVYYIYYIYSGAGGSGVVWFVTQFEQSNGVFHSIVVAIWQPLSVRHPPLDVCQCQEISDVPTAGGTGGSPLQCYILEIDTIGTALCQ